MSSSFRKCPNAYRMLQRMPAGIRVTFTLEQIRAIESALVPRTHVFDLRLAMPLLGKGAYLVFMAGPNRREKPRPTQKRSPAVMTGALSNAIALSNTCQSSPNAYRMLQRIPPEVGATFTPAQVHAMETALVPRSHAVDLRLSMPLLGKGAYLVFVAGPNRRAHYRDLQNRNPFVMPAVFASCIVGAGAILGLVHLQGSHLLEKPDPVFAKGEEFHPTVVPFKKNRQECEESGRQWINSECIDTIHDPVF